MSAEQINFQHMTAIDLVTELTGRTLMVNLQTPAARPLTSETVTNLMKIARRDGEASVAGPLVIRYNRAGKHYSGHATLLCSEGDF